MKREQIVNREALQASNETVNLPLKHEMKFYLPPGIKFSDIYMDTQEVAQELRISKRVVYNLRIKGLLSYTTLFFKVLYFRQEIAAILLANKVPAKNSLLEIIKKIK